LAATAIGVSPGELLDRLHHGDPEAVFAVAAAGEHESRVVERWNNLYEMLKDLGELWAK
jgi:hypothetical protein